jgi:uncharacterized protein (DUF1501 family)
MSTQKQPTLVVLQLTGGNDTLDTIVPYGDPLYYDNRRTVRVPEEEVLRIDNRFGFNPAMRAIKPFWDDGMMAIIAGVGVPQRFWGPTGVTVDSAGHVLIVDSCRHRIQVYDRVEYNDV